MSKSRRQRDERIAQIMDEATARRARTLADAADRARKGSAGLPPRRVKGSSSIVSGRRRYVTKGRQR